MPAPLPVRPDPTAASRDALQSLSRAALATGLRALSLSQYGAAVTKMLGADHAAGVVVKAATSPTTIGGSSPVLAQIAVVFVDALIPVSAAAALIDHSLQLQWDRAAEVRVPGLSIPHAIFIGEGGMFPVTQGTASIDAVLTPYKLGTLVELTGEMMRSTNAEQLIRAALISNVGASLDAALFSNVAGVPGVSPPGILHGVTPLTATAGGGLGAMITDLQSLAEGVATVAGNGGITLIASIKQAIALAMLPPGDVPFPVFSSSVVPGGTVIAVASQALATIVGAPQIEASQRTLVQEQENASVTISLYLWISRNMTYTFRSSSENPFN